MTVTDLIRELQGMPNQGAPVRVVISSVYLPSFGGHTEYLCELDAMEADDVRNEGPFVLIRSK